MRVVYPVIGAVLTALLAACGMNACGMNSDKTSVTGSVEAAPEAVSTKSPVTDKRLVNAVNDNANWLTYDKDYTQQRYSPLAQINDETVADLGLAWSRDLDTQFAVEATPLVIDGVMYIALPKNIIQALDARTGELHWEYKPQLDLTYGRVMCCGPITRGVAAWGDNLYVATIDGQLIALNRHSGKPVWKVKTAEMKDGYSISGAPRIIKGMVIVGNGGAEFGVRGYVTAYDAQTGEQKWRFYTVPGNPADGFENDAMAMAAKTWTGQWWKHGGGGTVWDSFAYDPELNLLYLGVGNGAPSNQKIRSPEGGDNLFLSSIVALNPDTGSYIWHYQHTPGEAWDYTATQQMTLLELEIDDKPRKTLVQAAKNGFFYVIDRETGEFLSANNYAFVNWATHIDQETGRPVETPQARYYKSDEPVLIIPGIQGAHDWQSMAYSRETGLVYIPTLHYGFIHQDHPEEESKNNVYISGVNHLAFKISDDPKALAEVRRHHKGSLVAWDPIKQEEVWTVEYQQAWNGGVLATGGNLVFQGISESEFVAYTADTGKALWRFPTESAAVAAPITYELDGEQYVAVMTGWGGAFSSGLGGVIPSKSKRHAAQLLVFKLGGTATATVFPDEAPLRPKPPVDKASPEVVVQGEQIYYNYCVVCHGEGVIASINFPDLRYSGFIQQREAFAAVVIDGVLSANGMSSFADKITADDAEKLRAYVIHRANINTPKDPAHVMSSTLSH